MPVNKSSDSMIEAWSFPLCGWSKNPVSNLRFGSFSKLSWPSFPVVSIFWLLLWFNEFFIHFFFRGSIHAYSEISPRPSNLSDSDLMSLVLKSAADEACFLFVVDSGRGRILYVSESVSKILNYSQRDLFGQCLFDVLHPKDISKVKEQMSSRNHTPQPRDRHDSDRHSEPKLKIPIGNCWR